MTNLPHGEMTMFEFGESKNETQNGSHRTGNDRSYAQQLRYQRASHSVCQEKPFAGEPEVRIETCRILIRSCMNRHIPAQSANTKTRGRPEKKYRITESISPDHPKPPPSYKEKSRGGYPLHSESRFAGTNRIVNPAEKPDYIKQR